MGVPVWRSRCCSLTAAVQCRSTSRQQQQQQLAAGSPGARGGRAALCSPSPSSRRPTLCPALQPRHGTRRCCRQRLAAAAPGVAVTRSSMQPVYSSVCVCVGCALFFARSVGWRQL
jgi:hypothetical protein